MFGLLTEQASHYDQPVNTTASTTFSKALGLIVKLIIVFGFLWFGVAHSKPLQDIINHYCKSGCISAQDLTQYTSQASKTYRVDQIALLAIIHVESKYHVKAKNYSSVGLSQIHLRYHKPKFLGKDYYNPQDNIFVGGKVFKDCLVRHKGNYPKAYTCYNGGGDKNYQSKVIKAYKMISQALLPPVTEDIIGAFIQNLDSPLPAIVKNNVYMAQKPLQVLQKTQRQSKTRITPQKQT